MVQINKHTHPYSDGKFFHRETQQNYLYFRVFETVSTPHLFDRLGWLSKLPKWAIPFSTYLCSVCIYLPCCLITRSLQESHRRPNWEFFMCCLRPQGTLLLSLVQHTNVQNILLLWFFTISVLHNTWHNIYNYHDCCGNNCNVYLHQGTSTHAIIKIWDVFCTPKIESKHSCTQQKRKTNNGQLSA